MKRSDVIGGVLMALAVAESLLAAGDGTPAYTLRELTPLLLGAAGILLVIVGRTTGRP